MESLAAEEAKGENYLCDIFLFTEQASAQQH
jgi:hypothetical protein